jgi:hypothetical protein
MAESPSDENHRPSVFVPIGEWGLVPEVGLAEQTIQGVLFHWFVRFNPLYFISAACVLAGVFQVASGLDQQAQLSR